MFGNRSWAILSTLTILLILFLLTLFLLPPTQTVQPLMLLSSSLFCFFVFFLSLLWNAQCYSSGDSPDREAPVHQIENHQYDQQGCRESTECI